jgi:hypothetical protein
MAERQVIHVTSWWQPLLGWFGIRTRALCGELIVATNRLTAVPVKCRECQRALAGGR